jgi:hypothetical protein
VSVSGPRQGFAEGFLGKITAEQRPSNQHRHNADIGIIGKVDAGLEPIAQTG